MKHIDQRFLVVVVFVGTILAGTAVAQTTVSTGTSSDTSSTEVKSKAIKSNNPKHPAIKKTVIHKQSEKDKHEEEAKAQVKAEQEAKLKAEAEAKAEQEARLKAEADAKAQREAEIAAQEMRLQDADALVKAGKPGEAFDLLEPMEFERSGEVRYDYLLGIAALDSGKSDKATLAFERVLTVDPNFAGARLDMARAYYQLGDLPRAKTEFEEVMKQNPPDVARATIQKYLALIDTQMHANDSHLSAYLEAALGHDSNVNAATSQGLVPVPALGNLPITLNSASVKSADDYLGVNGGVNAFHPVNGSVALYAGADVRERSNMSQTQFNSMNLNGSIGGIFALGKQDSLKLGLVDGDYVLGTARYYDNVGINGEWRHGFSPANQMAVFGQQMSYRFVDSAMNNQNFDQDVIGANWTHVMKDGRYTVFGSLFLGQEFDVTGQRPDGAKRFNGFRFGGQAALNDKTEFYANVGWNDGSYEKQNALFLTNRHDTLSDATMGANWHWDKLWTLRPQLVWTHNQSNISIYGYDRVDVSVTVRRDFN